MEVEKKKIETHGLELVFIGVIVFVAIILLTIVTYKIFIKERVKKSVEYNAATYFVVNSLSLKEYLLSPMQSMKFKDIQVTEKENYGICQINFTLTLNNNLTEEIEIGLVKVADFWIVYDAIISPNTPSAYYLVSTYQKILLFLERLDFQDYQTAEIYLDLIEKESRDPFLLDYLSARVNAIAGNSTYAYQLLDDLGKRVQYSRLSIWLEQGMIEFEREKFEEANFFFQKIVDEYATLKAIEKKSEGKSIFDGLPKDPLIATFGHDNVMAEAYKMLAESYRKTGQFEKSLELADKSIEHAKAIHSRVVLSASLLIKAFSLFDLNRYEAADEVLKEVIHDLENPNFSQKAWAWYYRAIIAVSINRNDDALDYYETAMGLDPYNSVFRKGAIEYLIKRNLVGDLDIALGYALRGIDYEIEKSVFQDLASRIYSLLGLEDKTKRMTKQEKY